MRGLFEIIELPYDVVLWFETFDLTGDITLNHPFDGPKNDLPIYQLTDEEKLYCALLELKLLAKRYETHNIDDAVLRNSLSDLIYRILRYEEENGFYGLSRHDCMWLRYIYRFEQFDFGSLRYQIFHMDYEEIERSGDDLMLLSDAAKRRFPEKIPLLNIHIRREADLRPEAVSSSLDEARYFFTYTFKNLHIVAFVTRSWLIYPGMRDLLSKNSNIYQFSKRFEEIASNTYPNHALERIYGTVHDSEIASINQKNSLQGSAYKNKNKLGVTFGSISFKD